MCWKGYFPLDPDVKGLYIKLAFINIIDVISNEYEIKCKISYSLFFFALLSKNKMSVFEAFTCHIIFGHGI